MKKCILTISIIFTMCLGASAQSERFFSSWSDEGARTYSDNTPAVPRDPIGLGQNSKAPLGSGLLVMTAMGAGYALIRKKE